MPADEVATTRREVEAMPAAGFALTVTEGRDRGRGLVLEAGRPMRALVGTSAACNLVLADPMVSRRHAAIEVVGMRLQVTDLGSTNGTQVNGLAVEVAYLVGGEALRIGSTTLSVAPRFAAAAKEATPASFGRLIGSSPRMRAVYSLCEQLAQSDLPVVVEGETGTGKELTAECIHEASHRARAPFVVFDATATPAAEVRGVLAGMLASAQGGTLLVDEVGDLPLEAQGLLLRAIERGEIVRPGEDHWTRIDVRVLAATSRDLDRLVETRKFREDLFFRLAVTRVDLPPLRRRRGDVPELAAHFFRMRNQPVLPGDFLERYEDYHWPGNVRELRSAVFRSLALGHGAPQAKSRLHGMAAERSAVADGEGDTPAQDDFRAMVDVGLPYTEARQRVVKAFERAYIEKLLDFHQGNVARAAAASGLARRYFQFLRARQQVK
jgi:two-component system, NtrC family, response regulator HydG